MFGKRVITALIGIILSVFIINGGGWLFAAAVAVITMLAWLEYSAMLARKAFHVCRVAGIFGLLLLLACAWMGNVQEMMFVITLFMLAIMSKPVFCPARFSPGDAMATLTGFLYIGVPFQHLLLLRNTDLTLYFTTAIGPLQAGAAYIWLAFIGTWASDTFAYLIGTRWGRHKLCPQVSPGKSIEGTVAGLVGSVLSLAGFALFLHLSPVHGIAIGVLVWGAASLGDLVESSLKRFAGVKDSGRLLPGHGGVLDRFDSILFAIPAVYYYITAFLIE